MIIVCLQNAAAEPGVKAKDMRSELKKIKSICDNHQTLCESFAQWKKNVDEVKLFIDILFIISNVVGEDYSTSFQNDAQLQILNTTAALLRKRHHTICEQIKKKPIAAEEVDRLQREISYVEAEVDVWMKELAEVNDARTNLDIEFIQLRSKLQKSMTNVEVASIDFDLLEKNHCATWKNFLCKTDNLR
uniref:Spectrin repeat-containing domain protein n=1 Tax=Syphacia muris TaxID=451379 RepID=A0A0N5AHW3_9BILA